MTILEVIENILDLFFSLLEDPVILVLTLMAIAVILGFWAVIRQKKQKTVFSDLAYKIGVFSLYGWILFLWLCTWLVTDVDIKFPVQRYDMDQELPWFAIGLTLQVFFAVLLLLLIALTREKPHIWVRLTLVFAPIMHTVLTRVYLVTFYGVISS